MPTGPSPHVRRVATVVPSIVAARQLPNMWLLTYWVTYLLTFRCRVFPDHLVTYEIGRITYRLDPRIGPLHRATACVARGGTQGGLNCLTHALPRCLPTPTEEADGNGYGAITGRSDPLGRRLE